MLVRFQPQLARVTGSTKDGGTRQDTDHSEQDKTMPREPVDVAVCKANAAKDIAWTILALSPGVWTREGTTCRLDLVFPVQKFPPASSDSIAAHFDSTIFLLPQFGLRSILLDKI